MRIIHRERASQHEHRESALSQLLHVRNLIKSVVAEPRVESRRRRRVANHQIRLHHVRNEAADARDGGERRKVPFRHDVELHWKRSKPEHACESRFCSSRRRRGGRRAAVPRWFRGGSRWLWRIINKEGRETDRRRIEASRSDWAHGGRRRSGGSLRLGDWRRWSEEGEWARGRGWLRG